VSKQTKQRKRAKEDGMHRTNQRKKELASKSDLPKDIMMAFIFVHHRPMNLRDIRGRLFYMKKNVTTLSRVSLTIEAVNPMCSRSCDIRHYALQMQMASEAKSCESLFIFVLVSFRHVVEGKKCGRSSLESIRYILSCHVKVMWVCRQCRILKYWCL
jgi:hypothetical protein